MKKNMWMGGSYIITDAQVTDITKDALEIEASIQEKGDKTSKEIVQISLDSDPVSGMAKKHLTLPPIEEIKLQQASKLPIDNFCRRMIRLCNVVKAYGAAGKIIQMGVQLGGKGVGKLKDDMYLNQVPHSEYIHYTIFVCILNNRMLLFVVSFRGAMCSSVIGIPQ